MITINQTKIIKICLKIITQNKINMNSATQMIANETYRNSSNTSAILGINFGEIVEALV